jgi:hypothetical protein
MYSWSGNFVSYTVSWTGKADGPIADMERMFNSYTLYRLVLLDTNILSQMPFSREFFDTGMYTLTMNNLMNKTAEGVWLHQTTSMYK